MSKVSAICGLSPRAVRDDGGTAPVAAVGLGVGLAVGAAVGAWRRRGPGRGLGGVVASSTTVSGISASVQPMSSRSGS